MDQMNLWVPLWSQMVLEVPELQSVRWTPLALSPRLLEEGLELHRVLSDQGLFHPLPELLAFPEAQSIPDSRQVRFGP